MQRAYQGRISFWHPRYRSEAEIVYSDEVPKGQIVENSITSTNKFESEIPVTRNPKDQKYVYHAAKTVQALLVYALLYALLKTFCIMHKREGSTSVSYKRPRNI